MKKILIMCNADPNSNPRPNRMLNWLKDKYQIAVVGRRKYIGENIKSHEYGSEFFMRGKSRKLNWLEAVIHRTGWDIFSELKRLTLRIINLALKRYEVVNWLNLGQANTMVSKLIDEHFDLIISHDLVLLPLAFQIKKDNTKLIFDAREYYTKEFADIWTWRLMKLPVNKYLCNTYLQKCDKVLTVSPGLSIEFKKEFNINAEVMMSCPEPHEIYPTSPNPEHIRMIHHGTALPSRRTELMLEMMDYVDERFTLDLMLIVSDIVYWNKIVSMAEARPNVQIIPSIPMQEIVYKIHQYDVGVFLLPPSNISLKYALPNKFFEFIQARLAVAIGPSIDMKKIVEIYDCGIISDEFTPQSLARELNNLSVEKLKYYKHQSHLAAQELNAEVTGKRMHEIVDSLLKE